MKPPTLGHEHLGMVAKRKEVAQFVIEATASGGKSPPDDGRKVTVLRARGRPLRVPQQEGAASQVFRKQIQS